MKKAIIIMFTATAIISLAACTKKMTPEKKQTPAEEIAEIKTKYSLIEIAKGKTIFENKCGECHDLRQPPEFSVREWNKILPTMVHKAGLSKEDGGVVRAWVITNAKAD